MKEFKNLITRRPMLFLVTLGILFFGLFPPASAQKIELKLGIVTSAAEDDPYHHHRKKYDRAD